VRAGKTKEHAIVVAKELELFIIKLLPFVTLKALYVLLKLGFNKNTK